ncbi:Mu transposase C-terminal domain-containing protein [Rhodanobacter sp. 7MK24]|uniref:Mu transposase C-terminal domain-containing protein n=1 Tax=Rhodanobacter sp. 7MK24 TaxID=2775922 RepID=UPI00177C8B92|nr:Mu transposase C-terminal domain-containing protein [Rhodanobacter sp. 7MK24]MBD8879794.1 Mu transposase C-terminal domain-containing protein [Rhodanobacter sp. 7MK24]
MQPLNELEFLATFLPGDARRLTRTGVQIHSLQYWSDELVPWVGQHLNVHVHYDPRDITHVFVRTPGGLLVKALVTTPDIQPISLAEWQVRRFHERSLSRSPELVALADASQKRADALVEQAKASRRIRRRKATEAAGDRYRSEPTPSAKPEPATVNLRDVEQQLRDYRPQAYDIEEFENERYR